MADETYTQLLENKIKGHFERNGLMEEMRSGLHVKVLQAMHGEQNREPLCGSDLKQRGLLQMLNHLVVDYFDWYGYKHTLETFALETGNKSQLKPRERLQNELGIEYVNKDLPILLQMLMRHTKLNKQKLQKLHIRKEASAKDTPPEGNSKKDARKIVKLHKKNVRKSQAKVNVRQRMFDAEQQQAQMARGKQAKVVESSSKSSTGSSSRHETSDESDAFEHMPYRHCYIEKDPPESAYPHDFGEEGPCERAHCSKASVKPNDLQQNPLNEEEKPQCSRSAANSSQSKLKRNKILFHAHKLVPSDDDVDIPVRKPTCPETMVSKISLASSGDSDEDSDEYL